VSKRHTYPNTGEPHPIAAPRDRARGMVEVSLLDRQPLVKL
jgi:hypothetical protein